MKVYEYLGIIDICLKYWETKSMIDSMRSPSVRKLDGGIPRGGNTISNPTLDDTIRIVELSYYVDMIDKCVNQASPKHHELLLLNVTTGILFEDMIIPIKLVYNMYDERHKFYDLMLESGALRCKQCTDCEGT